VKTAGGQKLAGRRSAAKMLTKDEARQIAANFAFPARDRPRSALDRSHHALTLAAVARPNGGRTIDSFYAVPPPDR